MTPGGTFPAAAGAARVVHVSSHEPFGANKSQGAQLGSSLTPLFSPRQQPPFPGGILPPRNVNTPSNRTELSYAPTVQGTRSAGGPSRPVTAGDITPSASLPSLLPQQGARGVSPYAEDLRNQRENGQLRRRIKELEAENKRTAQALGKYRQMHQVNAAYGQGGALFHPSQPAPQPEPAGEPTIPLRQHEEAMALQRRQYEQKIASMQRQHSTELSQREAQSRSQEELDAARLQREKEERVELLKRQIARRMMNAGISRCWTAWADFYQRKTYAMARLRECANRLRRPELSQAFGVWVGVWEAVLHKREIKAARAREAEIQGEAGSLVEEVERLKEQLAAAEEDKAKALERQLVELTGSAQQLAELAAEKEKEGRVELLRRQMLRRMMNAGLTNAWSAWYELWAAKTYAMARLREVGNKFKPPELAGAFGHWLADFEEAKRAAERAELERQANSLEAQLRHARLEKGQLEMVRVAHEDELKALREKVAELEEARKHKGVDLTAQLAAATKEAEEARQLHASAEAENLTLERKREEAEEDAKRQHLEDKRLLEKLLSEQRRAFEDELEKFRLEVEAEKDAKAREERIELLRRQVTRRMMNRGISMGFTAWSDYVQAKAYALNRLREVGNHLRAPELARTYAVWQRYAEACRQRAKLTESKRKIALLTGQSERTLELEEELEQLRKEIEAVTADRAALRERVSALDGGVAEAERLREEELAKEKEERVELLRRQIGRRIMNQDITRGFTAWCELWEAKTYAMARLREVGNRFRSPELSVAFSWWSRYIEMLAQRKLEREFQAKAVLLAGESERVGSLEDELAQVRSELARVVSERSTLREKISALDGGVAEAERMREEQLEAAKQERIELLRRQVMRRMMNAGLASGWAAWHELWEAKTYAMARLREVGNRFRSPGIALAFGHWADRWESSFRAREMAELRAEAMGIAGEATTMQLQLAELRAEMERKLAAAAEEKRVALERQLVELTGSAEANAALEEQRAKEERVELLRRQIGRRIMNQDITRGFTAWCELWAAKTYAMARLREVGNKFKSPELADAFGHWSDTWAVEKREAQRAEMERLSKSLEAQLRRARHEAGQLELVKVAQQDELQALKDKAREAADLAAARESELQEALVAVRENPELREQRQVAIEARALAEEKLKEAEEDHLKSRQSDRQLLEKLLTEQRKQFEDESAQSRQMLSQRNEERRTAEEEMTRLNGELAKARAEMQKLVQQHKDEEKKLQQQIDKLKKPPPKPKEPPKKKLAGNPLSMLDLDESPDAPPISVQIANALRKNSGKVLDLFRSWDTDGDGEVSRKEFREAMPALGLDVPVKEVDKLFSEWDKGGDGALEFKELKKILSTPVQKKAQENLQKATTTAVAGVKMMKMASMFAPSPAPGAPAP
jgi:hypothetical protein